MTTFNIDDLVPESHPQHYETSMSESTDNEFPFEQELYQS